MQVVCPACLALNRVPDERLGDAPKCGQCRQPLLPAAPLELTGTSFDRLVGRSELPVLVDFWAGWCGPCKMMAPVFAQLAGEYLGRVVFAKVDTEAETALAQRYAIRSIPSLVMFKGGREAGRQAGALDAASLRRWLDSR